MVPGTSRRDKIRRRFAIGCNTNGSASYALPFKLCQKTDFR